MSDQTPPPGDLPPPPGSFPPPPPPPAAPPGFSGPPPAGYTAFGAETGRSAFEPASFGTRLLALLVDGLIISVPFWILAALVQTGDDRNFRFGYGYQPGAEGWLNLMSTIVSVCYYGYFEGGPTGQTIGKRVLGVRVVDAASGQPGIGFGRAVGRYFASILSAIPCLLGYFWMLWDDRKQTWHDKLLSTNVAKL
jgi:uncharacterized RDD family membrane protein YckC